MSPIPTRLKDALRAAGRRPMPMPPLPKEPLVARARSRIPSDMLGIAAPVRGRNYNRIAADIRQRCQAGIPLDRRVLRDAPWCLWASRPPLAWDEGCVSAVLTAIAANPRRRALRALASAWLAGFGPDRPGIAAAADLLRRYAPQMGEPWHRLAADDALFDVKEGPRRIAAAALAMRKGPVAVLKQRGLGGLDSGSGYARACLAQLLDSLEQGRIGDAAERLALVRSVAVRPDGRLVFPDLGPLACRALLRPFGGDTPEPAVMDACLDLLLSLFGDPRQRPDNWALMAAEDEMIRPWLAGQSLRQFLEVAEREAAGIHASGGHWPIRRRFWEAVHAAGLIREAWTIFGPRGVDLARRAFGEHASFGSFARDGRIQAEPGPAVVLLRIGSRGLVADWSFNGLSHIWLDYAAPDAPRLYKPHYAPAELRIGEAEPPGAGMTACIAHDGDWLDRVAAQIRAMTGVSVAPPRDM